MRMIRDLWVFDYATNMWTNVEVVKDARGAKAMNREADATLRYVSVSACTVCMCMLGVWMWMFGTFVCHFVKNVCLIADESQGPSSDEEGA
jgi:hypothetical protein